MILESKIDCMTRPSNFVPLRVDLHQNQPLVIARHFAPVRGNEMLTSFNPR